MTTTTLPNRYQINGLIDTTNDVLSNMETLATTAGSLISFDATAGKWDVVILKTESTTRTFTDSDIIGGIQVNGSGLDEMYNSVMVEFPLRDTADEVDFVRVAVAAQDRNPNEPDNELVIQLAQCNEPVQAEIIALQELKQNRADLIVDFTVDWTASDINPGDVVGITNTAYGWTDKLFRVITIERIEDGAITYRITAQQYDPAVYDTSNLNRFVRSDRNGIKAAGAIGTPIQPQVTDYQLVARPRLEIETVVPSGLVESMEFWISSDGTNYTQIDTEYPVGGGNFPPGTTVVADFDRLDGQNVYVKTRGMNSTTTGPFSPPSTLLAFVPKQQTEAIGNSTDVVDGSGNSLLGLISSNGLLALLKGLLEDNETGTNSFTGTLSLFDEMFDTHAIASGVDLTWPDTVNGIRYSEAATTGQFTLPIIAEFGSTTVTNIPTGSNNLVYSKQFLCPASGTYKFDLIADQNTSGARGTSSDTVTVGIVVPDPAGGADKINKGSGGPGTWYWMDYVLSGTADLVQNQVYTMNFYVTNNTALGGVASFDFGWQVMAVGMTDFGQFPPPYAVMPADYAVLTYEFFSGLDLDIRFRRVNLATPPVGISDWIGWPGDGTNNTVSDITLGGANLAEWGGDNTGQGVESVLINLDVLDDNSVPISKYECRAFWYQTASDIPVKIYGAVYEGGTMSVQNFQWTNTGATRSREFAGYQATISTLTQNPATTGDLIGYLNIDRTSNRVYFTTT